MRRRRNESGICRVNGRIKTERVTLSSNTRALHPEGWYYFPKSNHALLKAYQSALIRNAESLRCNSFCKTAYTPAAAAIPRHALLLLAALFNPAVSFNGKNPAAF